MATTQHCPSPRVLDDLELRAWGVLPGPVDAGEFDLPSGLAADEPDLLELVDPEGLPLARLHARDAGGWTVEPLARPAHGPFRRLRLSPDEVREQHPGAVRVPVESPLSPAQRAELAAADGEVLLLVLAGDGWPRGTSPLGLVRSTLAAVRSLSSVHVVVVPLARTGDVAVDAERRERVVAAYAGDAPVVELGDGGGQSSTAAAERAAGLVVFFTGLSGSGKSTVARALVDHLLETTERTVTSLDGDVVRRNLSAGLTFSREDRETNIRRIGWVAAEIARHGGVAVCSPIAPYDATRRDVRRLVADAGGRFVLVHVATPVEECERRDRKGLYAKARAGEIPDFTGISAPYEVPEDADVVVDTTGLTVEEALAPVLAAIAPGVEVGGEPVVEVGREPVVEVGREPLVEVGALAPLETTAEVGAPAPLETPLKVLVVCTANICRSPYMELALQAAAGDAVVVAGAGTHGYADHPMDEHMAAEARARGLDPAQFRSRPLTRALIDDADLVLTAESRHRSLILDESPGAFRKVFTLGQFARGVEGLEGPVDARAAVAHVGANRPSAEGLDIADPFRRGPVAAAECAALIDGLVEKIADHLARP
ncbi:MULTISPECIES: adenylyl-sulfate kinase [unclassified Nocardioides]|uniref:adenylyl-sulfate kinase n=1 Tax=unclassified Nocardioides TaxID=2615069 RepID=UPI00240582F1|nr:MULTISPECIES: adenylyl-sulfate kinase [unclassified Nocardioides]